MIDYSDYFAFLKTTALADLARRLEQTVADRQAAVPNADIPRWCQTLQTLPDLTPSACRFHTGTVSIGLRQDAAPETLIPLRHTLLSLHPWRKGPFSLFGIHIDAEWRSDLKWARLQHAIAPLEDRLVLDVGCGNGYYLYRMLGQQARAVIGIDPFWLSVMQFQAINHFARVRQANVLPLRVEDLPLHCRCFDTVFSMGILYHRRDPLAHLRDLMSFLRPGGQLVLETLVLDSAEKTCLVPRGRYAKMRNVWAIPSVPMLQAWLKETGYHPLQLIDVTPTTLAEQRPTAWMTWESVPDFLDPADPGRTVEGHPAPIRALILATRPP